MCCYHFVASQDISVDRTAFPFLLVSLIILIIVYFFQSISSSLPQASHTKATPLHNYSFTFTLTPKTFLSQPLHDVYT